MSNSIRAFLVICLALTTTNCGLLIGNVKPVEEKSEKYRILDLSQENADWEKLPPVNGAKDSKGASESSSNSGDLSDLAYQSKKTASIISLNSACRASNVSSEVSLQEFTRELLLGISDVTQRNENNLTIQNTPALETTIQGTLNQEAVMLRTVVIKSGECVYDLMYVARPEQFATQEPDFTRFVQSMRIR